MMLGLHLLKTGQVGAGQQYACPLIGTHHPARIPRGKTKEKVTQMLAHPLGDGGDHAKIYKNEPEGRAATFWGALSPSCSIWPRDGTLDEPVVPGAGCRGWTNRLPGWGSA